MSDLKIAMLPMEISWGDKETNIHRVEQLLEQVHPETDLVVLPETFSTGFPNLQVSDKEDVRILAERNTGTTVDRLKYLAAKYSVAICGSFIADSGGSLYNRAFFIEPGGDEAFADKHHLFTMADEQKVFSRGYDRLSVRYRGWNISMVVCYDIRFPVWCRNVDNEYDLLVAVANWPEVRVDAWNKLLPARAIENEAFMVGVDCRGTDAGDFVYDGSSAAYDFKGKDITIKTDNPEILYASLSHEKLERFRDKFPAWRDADPFRLLTP